jgi:uncharacterized protein (TIGR02444 family)
MLVDPSSSVNGLSRINSLENPINPEAAWQWCGQRYAADEARWLAAQDARGVDVVFELFGDWLAAQGMPLSDAERAEGHAHVSRWREQVVVPLRAVRRALKDEPAPGAGGGRAAAQVRRQVQQAELRAERAELDALCGWLSALRARSGRP